jgi:alkanesulfonate monooxygenase SsuD/methylene tetrahydromethanopterin reductase-like flavin-dependent oxidoreductase (luciferase family)
MVGVDVPPGGDDAYIFKQDFYGRIFINISRIPESNFKTTLAHELTHLRRVNRFATTVGANAYDNFYLWESEMSTLTGNAENRYAVKEEGVSNVIMNGGLTINYMEPHWGFDEFLRRVSSLNEGPDFQGVDQALQVFNTQPRVSARMAAENADSLAFAALSLQRQYRFRQQDAEVARMMAHW